jgi:hypothetical protein
VASALLVRRVRVILALAVAATTATLVVGVAPAGAALGIACPNPTSVPFAPWADYANYAFIPDGGFESGASGWTLSGGASVRTGNESFYVHSSSDRNSLSLPAGSSATTPTMCIGLLSTKMRFVAAGDSNAKVKVQIIYRGLLSSVLGILDGGTIDSSGTWEPSPQMTMLGGLLPLLTQGVQFRFVALNGSSTLDDVYLDPMKSA